MDRVSAVANTMKKYYVCSCFYTNNFFLRDQGVHVVYKNRGQFMKDYQKWLAQKCQTEEQREEICKQLEWELKRRQGLGKESLERTAIIAQNYKPLHPHVYSLKESFLAKEFLSLVEYCKQSDATVDGVRDYMEKQAGERVYVFPVFNKDFCTDFMEEVSNFEKSDLPKGRPNTMNNYGILLNELGFDDGFMTPFRTTYLQPVTRLLFPDWGGDGLDSHKAFIVQYKCDEDKDLKYHFDNAEVTINVSLGKEFSDGSLYFGQMRTEQDYESGYTEYVHRPMCGLLHRGQHKHGAFPISHGERYNLIIWMRSSKIRNQLCPMCDQKPELVETVGYGDGFTKEKEEKTVNI